MNGFSIFIDESGDLGFDFKKTRTQPFFIIGALVCKNAVSYREIQKAVNRTLKNKLNRKPKSKRIVEELKGARTDFNIKQYFYSYCCHNTDWTLYFYILHKRKVPEHLRTLEGRHRLYNFLAKELVERIEFYDEDHIINLYLDKCRGSKEEVEFNNYIKTYLETKVSLKTRLNCYHHNSTLNKGIQAIDMFLWGIYEKYNFQRIEWYDLFKDRIDFEDTYLK